MNKYDMSADIERVLLSEQDLKEMVSRIGKEICQDYQDSRHPLILVSGFSYLFF